MIFKVDNTSEIDFICFYAFLSNVLFTGSIIPLLAKLSFQGPSVYILKDMKILCSKLHNYGGRYIDHHQYQAML